MKLWVAVAMVSIALAGCAAKAPNYSTSPAATQSLQAARVQPAKVGEFTAAPGAANKSISLRASTMEPPQGTYSQYLADAIKTELDLVKLYSAASNTEISGVLLRNELETGLAVKGNGLIEAKIVVQRDGSVRFDKTKVATIEWDSNFIGAIAIPRAQQEYSRLVQTLVAQFFGDPDFVTALK
jgi:hypothetical protein